MLVGRAAAMMVAIAFLFLGCASGGQPASPRPAGTNAGGTSPSPPPGPAVWLPDWTDARTPEQVVNRRPLPFCGIEEAPPARPGEYFDATVRSCFWTAKLDGREAEFVSVQPTMEGDRIATIYRLRVDGGVDQLIDFTQDKFGGGGWTITTCSRLVEEPGDRLFGADGCDEGQPI
jgi:hypothetical protein